MRRTLLPLLLLLASAAADPGARYLVFCQDNLIPEIEPLVEWKRASGLSTRVVPLSDVGYDTTRTRNYIITAWTEWDHQPEYVLIVAHPGVFRAKIHGYGSEMVYSDVWFGDVEGDFRGEIPVGRIPARNADQLRNAVARTLAYEHHPDTTNDWQRRLTTVIREDGDREDDSIYWHDIRWAAYLAGTSGFAGCDSLSSARGHNTASIINSVNAGTGFVMYRGRATANWYAPFEIDPRLAANSTRLPVVLSFTCATMALDPYDSMVGRAWLFAGSDAFARGAVAFFGNTHSDQGVADKRSALARGFFSALFTDNEYWLGRTALRARQYLYDRFPGDACKDDYRGFNIFGDPGLRLWTGTPRGLEVFHPAELQPGPARLEIAVTNAGTPVAGAVACASMDSSVYAVDTTDAQGNVAFDLAVPEGELRLVVTGRNLYPYDVIIPVRASGVALEPRVPTAAGLRVLPNPGRDWVRLELAAALAGRPVSVYDAAGELVGSVRATDGAAVLPVTGLAPGVYLARCGPATARFTVTR